jgi:hypothetical protein
VAAVLLGLRVSAVRPRLSGLNRLAVLTWLGLTRMTVLTRLLLTRVTGLTSLARLTCLTCLTWLRLARLRRAPAAVLRSGRRSRVLSARRLYAALPAGRRLLPTVLPTGLLIRRLPSVARPVRRGLAVARLVRRLLARRVLRTSRRRGRRRRGRRLPEQRIRSPAITLQTGARRGAGRGLFPRSAVLLWVAGLGCVGVPAGVGRRPRWGRGRLRGAGQRVRWVRGLVLVSQREFLGKPGPRPPSGRGGWWGCR